MTGDLLPGATLAEAQQWLRERVDKGAPCPCCTQHTKVYHWPLYSTAVQALKLYYQLGGTTEYVHSNALKAHGHRGQGDAARLRMWGLVEREKDARPDGGKSGFWRVPVKGEQFLLGLITIPKYCNYFDGRVLGFDGPNVDVRHCLGTAFNYDEFVRGL